MDPRAQLAAKRGPVLFRFYVSGWDGENWDTVSAWGPTADAALATAQLHHRLGKPEVDCVPDCMKLADGTLVPLERTQALRILLHLSIEAGRAPITQAAAE